VQRFFRFAVFAAFLGFSFSTLRADEPTAEVLIARKLCDLQDARINESSGLAASRRYAAQSLLWTHNDSGGEPALYTINPQGETVAEVLLQGATNVDWEDIAVAGDWIYVADTGDNLRRREDVTIYRVREPQLDANKTNQKLEVEPEAMTLKYPEGARDCETILVTAKGEVLVVSKNGGPSLIFKTPQPFQNGITQTLEQVGEYSFTGKTAYSYLTTGGSVSPDGKKLVIRTYTHAYEWQIPAKNNWRALWKTAPRKIELPPTKQGESIAYSADGSRFFLTSEGVPAPLFLLENEE
jgi:hypothetical protein